MMSEILTSISARKTMRDVFIDQLYERMHEEKKLFFLSADFGSPALDKLRKKFKDRFINVGIAEQNLINVATGLAKEGFDVYAYAIAPFLTMRAYEQIRVNLALFSQLETVNVNLIGVGAGISYDVAGPTHHCLEDIAIMRVLPNMILFSPSDWVQAKKFVDYTIQVKKPKYIRFDGKPLPHIYDEAGPVDFSDGFSELREGKKICLISTGYMTHVALKIAEQIEPAIGLIDVFMLNSIDEKKLFSAIKKYDVLITMEEGFVNKGGMDSLVAYILDDNCASPVLRRIGFPEKYIFSVGNRDFLYQLNGIGEEAVMELNKGYI